MSSKTMTNSQLKDFFESLNLVYHSGLPVAEGFGILHDNATEGFARGCFANLSQATAEGSSLYEALKDEGHVPAYALTLVRIGEQTGRLEETMAGLADYYDRRDVITQSVRSALVYPLSMLIVVLVVLVVLLTQAMPVFDTVFAQLGLALSGPAAALLAFGSALNHAAPWIALVLVVVIVVAVLAYLWPVSRRVYSWFFQHLPGLRGLSLSISAQRFAVSLSSLLDTGLDVDQAIDYAQPLMADKRAQAALTSVAAALDDGQDFLAALKGSGLFEPEAVALLSIGMKTGAGSVALRAVADQISRSTQDRIERLVAAIEPILVAVMCVLVGIVLLSVMLPLMGVLAGI
jgi:type IV pilus assembly protein PilC